MKKIIILLILVLLIAGGGVGAAYVFVPELLGMGPKTTAEVSEASVAPVEAKKPEKPTTLHMNTIDVPLVIGDTIDRKIYFDVTLIVNPDEFSNAQIYLPRLRNDYIEFCYAAFPKQYEKNGRMNLEKLKFSLKKIAQKTLGENVIFDVLIQSYVER